LGEGGAEAEEPQSGGGDAVGSQAAQVCPTVADEDVAEEVIVDDEGGHLRRGQIGIVQGADKVVVLLSGERRGQEPLSLPGREQDHGIAKIEDRHASALIETPSVPDRSRDRHLAATGNQEFSWGRHRHLTW